MTDIQTGRHTERHAVKQADRNIGSYTGQKYMHSMRQRGSQEGQRKFQSHRPKERE